MKVPLMLLVVALYAYPASAAGNACRYCAKNKPGKLLGTFDLKAGLYQLTKEGGKALTVLSIKDPTISDKNGCDVKGLLRINITQGTVIKFTFEHGDNITGFNTINIGDSPNNNGLGGGCSSYSNLLGPNNESIAYSADCAEMVTLCNNLTLNMYGTYLPGIANYTNQPPLQSVASNYLLLNQIPNAITQNLTLWAGQGYMAANTGQGLQVCYDNDMVYMPTTPIPAPDNFIYLGMNRNIRNDKTGVGLCKAALYSIDSCSTGS